MKLSIYGGKHSFFILLMFRTDHAMQYTTFIFVLSCQTNMKRVSDDIMTLEYYWLIVYVYIRGGSKGRWDNTNRNPISSS